ncbi:alpha/beta-hydrolase [Corynespora cassiicola Philippines]|uniref:Alpha/beta-hydrolase n=1 Tax=Corynespora cassiicola Philippines TaxID=1448308 RepID=A0A2T2P812_CORCC|nr:alpha/beta-hydrolase [Corynespora cassiicola Philippines]
MRASLFLSIFSLVWRTSAAEQSFSSLSSLAEPDIVQGTLKVYGNDSYPIYMRRMLPTDSPRARYVGHNRMSYMLKKGTIRREGAKQLESDIVFEQDVPVRLRDGTIIYTDIFRPVGEETAPAIVSWSPYGKQVGGQWLDDLPGRSGVPLNTTSELQKWEAVDPSYWVARGYAVLNPDTRGSYMSEGNATYWGRQLAEDGYDFIEWAADQSWSSGKIGMAGNSWLAISQWFIAAENPPHLAAIAPWEGATDILRDGATSNGLGNLGFEEAIITTLAGAHYVEDSPRMALDDSLDGPYWQNRRANLEKITVPAYVVASYTNAVHTHGSFDGYRRISSQSKWLRVHNTHEWRDFYQHTEDLYKFFQRFLKGVDNGWERDTPRVRLAVLDPGSEDIVDRPVEEWPLPTLEAIKLHLGENRSLCQVPNRAASSVSYSADAMANVTFQWAVPELTEIVGYMKLRLWVEAIGSNDMEIAVRVEKRAANGSAYPGSPSSESTDPVGRANIRVSRRALDSGKSTDFEPYLLHEREDLLREGDIVPVEIGLWPTALRFHPGELIYVTVSPTILTPATLDMGWGVSEVQVPAVNGTFEPSSSPQLVTLGGALDSNPPFINAQRTKTATTRNNGLHVIHFGGKYDSHILLPVNKASSAESK